MSFEIWILLGLAWFFLPLMMFAEAKKMLESIPEKVKEQVKIRLDYEIGKRRSEDREWLQVEIKKQIIQFVQEQKLKASQKKAKEE